MPIIHDQRPDSEHGRLLRVGEVAARLQISAQTVARWADARKLSCAQRTAGGHRRFREDDVEALRQRLSAPRGGETG